MEYNIEEERELHLGSRTLVSQDSGKELFPVVDENGATDITDAILGEGEGDGKIYDLNGIRVMQPVKGRLYIVNGKKKVYE